MDFVPILRSRKKALEECSVSQQFSAQKQQKLREDIKILNIAPWITKGVILTGIIFGVNWKKQVPLSKRELPLAVAAITLSAISDYAVNQYVWKRHQVDIVRLTGFKNGVFVNPDRMKKMRQKMNILQGTKYLSDDDLIIENDQE